MLKKRKNVKKRVTNEKTFCQWGFWLSCKHEFFSDFHRNSARDFFLAGINCKISSFAFYSTHLIGFLTVSSCLTGLPRSGGKLQPGEVEKEISRNIGNRGQGIGDRGQTTF